MSESKLYRYTAFSDRADGGNPAGVWVGDVLPPVREMQRIAAEVGFSETAFMAPRNGEVRDVRYFSPEAEVSFCGHATIASGVLLGMQDGIGDYRLQTQVGEVLVNVRQEGERFVASLTSVEPRHEQPSATLLDAALAALNWSRSELDPSLPPAKAYAGAWHLIIAVKERSRLQTLDYAFDELKTLMLEHELTTLQLIWQESSSVFHARNPFPVGGVVEDPATGAAAAALGGYLRNAGYLTAPGTLHIHQGVDMGRPSEITVSIPEKGGIVVSGTAVSLDG
ncbi:PhzF family phenazine biosynthesis protein [Woeseia oceani]|uniref:Phenazine biosynthesis protein PhzF n=1 Tax=Woeseia oceani TaxID=1548547 RepID=A0A193LFZ7_9GAMM|nr:PhzF family phenazine biosynthesis protein [Woeseia oceani]ANO51386.1 phenazine biosynthesis protein PhzF [Woeseia oceani]